MAELSEDEQDQIVVTLAVDIETLSEEEFTQLYDQLDADHQMEVSDNIRDFADNAVGSPHWDD